MDLRVNLVLLITMILTSAFLFIWMRRDNGIVPEDRLPDVLHEPLDGLSPSPARLN